jgi:hypothetical protein
MHFSVITSAALLLAPLAAAQFAVYARDATSDLSARGVNDLKARDALDIQFARRRLRRAPVYTSGQVADAQDHIKGQTATYNEESQNLDAMHADPTTTSADIAAQHTKMQGIAQE